MTYLKSPFTCATCKSPLYFKEQRAKLLCKVCNEYVSEPVYKQKKDTVLDKKCEQRLGKKEETKKNMLQILLEQQNRSFSITVKRAQL